VACACGTLFVRLSERQTFFLYAATDDGSCTSHSPPFCLIPAARTNAHLQFGPTPDAAYACSAIPRGLPQAFCGTAPTTPSPCCNMACGALLPLHGTCSCACFVKKGRRLSTTSQSLHTSFLSPFLLGTLIYPNILPCHSLVSHTLRATDGRHTTMTALLNMSLSNAAGASPSQFYAAAYLTWAWTFRLLRDQRGVQWHSTTR